MGDTEFICFRGLIIGEWWPFSLVDADSCLYKSTCIDTSKKRLALSLKEMGTMTIMPFAFAPTLFSAIAWALFWWLIGIGIWVRLGLQLRRWVIVSFFFFHFDYFFSKRTSLLVLLLFPCPPITQKTVQVTTSERNEWEHRLGHLVLYNHLNLGPETKQTNSITISK